MENIIRPCLQSSEKLHPLNNCIDLYKIETVSSVQSTIYGEYICNVNKLYNYREVIKNSDREIGECYAVMRRIDYNEPETITDVTQSIKLELEEDNESMDDNCFDSSEPMGTATVDDDIKLEIKEENVYDISFDSNTIVRNDIELKLKANNQSKNDNGFNNSEPVASATVSDEVLTSVFSTSSELYHLIASSTVPLDGTNLKLNNDNELITNDDSESMNDESESTDDESFYSSEPITSATVGHRVYTRVLKNDSKRYSYTQIEPCIPRWGICYICGVLVRTEYINKHISIHLEEPVECKVCGKMLKNSGSLKSHSNIHKGLTHTCEKCGKSISSRNGYYRHLSTHNGKKVQNLCKICGKTVRDMKKHIRSHTGERPYPCSYCKKGFSTLYARRVHTRLHTNEKPYVCTCCDMAFPVKVSLKTHLMSKHNVEITSSSNN